MHEWKPEAREYFEGYLRQVAAMAQHRGEDADDIVSSLREHVDHKLDEIGAIVVTLDDLREALKSVGTPDAILDEQSGTAPVSPLQSPTSAAQSNVSIGGRTLPWWLLAFAGVVFLLSVSTTMLSLVSGAAAPMVVSALANVASTTFGVVVIIMLIMCLRGKVPAWIINALVVSVVLRVLTVFSWLPVLNYVARASANGNLFTAMLTSTLHTVSWLLFLLAMVGSVFHLDTLGYATEIHAQRASTSEGSKALWIVLAVVLVVLGIPAILLGFLLLSFVAIPVQIH